MNTTLRRLATLLSFTVFAAGLTGAAAAQQRSDIAADYSHSLPLQISGAQGVVSVRLPQAVYLHARTSRLDDLRIFDAKGIAQPYALYRPSPQEEVRRTTQPASLFPVHAAKQAAGAGAFDLAVQTRPDGSVSSVQIHSADKTTREAPTLDSLVLDFGPWQTRAPNGESQIEALRFDAPKDRANYSAEVWLAVSNDLKSWKTAGASELSWLSNGDAQMLANDRLEISPQRFRYARLSWRRGEPAQFAGIRAELSARQSSAPVRETVWLAPASGKHPGDLVYRAGPALPVERIDLRLNETNIVYPMMLGSYVERPIERHLKRPFRKNRPAEETEKAETVFQPILRATFYRITQDGETRRSELMAVTAGRHSPEWVVRPLNPTSTARPELGLSWQPATLVFLAGGTPPYALRFGRIDATPASLPLDQVAPGFSPGELDRLEKAVVGGLQTGEPHRAASPLPPATNVVDKGAQAGQPAQTRSVILWGVLLLGVVVLAAMVWGLVRQMGPGKPPK